MLSGTTDADQFRFCSCVRNCHLSDMLGEADDACSWGKSRPRGYKRRLPKLTPTRTSAAPFEYASLSRYDATRLGEGYEAARVHHPAR